MKISVQRRAVVISVLVAACVLPFLAAGAYLVVKHRWASARLAEIEPRYARLLGIDASRAELTRALSESAGTLGRYTYPSSQGTTQSGNDAQQRVRDISTKAGLTLISSQVLPAKAEGVFERIPLVVKLEGDLPSLQAALVVLAAQTPALNFDGLSVQTIGAVRPEVQQRLAVQFNLFVLRVRG